jgi:outer membrane lipoprotein
MRLVQQSLLRLLSGILLLTAGCAAQSPDLIRNPSFKTPPVADVRARPEAYQGVKVRWGGEVIAVENRAKESWVEVLSRPLESGGRPREGERQQGRILVQVGRFLDPEEYGKGRAFTVTGRLVGSVQRKIGGYPYLYPLVKADAIHLWPPRRETPVRPPYYHPHYSPYYDPWHPYAYPHPWWSHPYW